MDIENATLDLRGGLRDRDTKQVATETERSGKQIVTQHNVQPVTMVKQTAYSILIDGCFYLLKQ
jgi:hypothetical protein